jgi:hypothetical protein
VLGLDEALGSPGASPTEIGEAVPTTISDGGGDSDADGGSEGEAESEGGLSALAAMQGNLDGDGSTRSSGGKQKLKGKKRPKSKLQFPENSDEAKAVVADRLAADEAASRHELTAVRECGRALSVMVEEEDEAAAEQSDELDF